MHNLDSNMFLKSNTIQTSYITHPYALTASLSPSILLRQFFCADEKDWKSANVFGCVLCLVCSHSNPKAEYCMYTYMRMHVFFVLQQVQQWSTLRRRIYQLFPLVAVYSRPRSENPALTAHCPLRRTTFLQPLCTQSNPWFRQIMSSASPKADTTRRQMIYQELTKMKVSQE